MKKLQLCALTLAAIMPLLAPVALSQGEQSKLPPLNSGGVVVVDLPGGSAESIKLDIKQGRFASQSVGRLVLDAQGIDFKQGSLKSLGAQVLDGNFDNVPVDELRLDTSAFSFDTLELLNHRRFVLDQPVNATVSLKISENNLNSFIANPKTIEKLEKAITKKTGNMHLISFSNPSLNLMGKNRVRMNLTTSIGNAVATPMELNGTVGINGGKLAFNKLQLTSNGVELPVDIAGVLQSKLNEMIDLEKLGKNNFVIKAQDLNISNKTMEVRGRASLTRLEFGK